MEQKRFFLKFLLVSIKIFTSGIAYLCPKKDEKKSNFNLKETFFFRRFFTGVKRRWFKHGGTSAVKCIAIFFG